MRKSLFVLIVFIIGMLIFNPSLGWAQATEDTQEDRLEESLEAEKGRAATSAEELIEMLKKRALLKKEERRREQLLATKGTIGLHFGYDNNVNTDTDRRGVEYFEQYFSFNWVPTFNEYFGAEIGPWYYSDIYLDNQDTTILDWAFKAMLKYFPNGKPHFELQPGVERQWVHYPEAENSSYIEDKAFLKIKHRFWQRWSQEGKYEYSFKEYDKKHPRTGPISTSYITDLALEKNKHTLEYILGFPLDKNNCKIKFRGYQETSNDHYRDYYDLYDYKITGEIGRSLTKKLYAKLSSSYERKNYCHRTVTAVREAQTDKIFTHKLYLYYTLKKGWTLSYTLTRKQSRSNYDIYDYQKLSHLGGIYISF